MTVPSGCWSGASGIACANEAKVKAKTTAINLVISFAPRYPSQSSKAWHLVAGLT
jgi:hypothetical protein